MTNQVFSELETAILLRDAALGHYKRNKSQLRLLYEFHRYIRWAEDQNHPIACPSVLQMAKNADCSESQVHRFFRSPLFQTFGERVIRKGESSHYRLNETIKRLFRFLEKKGVMKMIRNDFDAFHKNFKKFMDNFIIWPLQNGMTLHRLINKLSTKSERIRHPLTRDYGTQAVTTFGVTKLSKDDKKKVVVLGESELPDVNWVHHQMRNRLNFSEKDTQDFFYKNKLCDLKKAVALLTFRINTLKWEPRSRCRALQAIINEQRMAA